MNYQKTEETKRIITIEFEDDREYCGFIKGLGQIENISQFPLVHEIFNVEFEEIIDNSKLNDIYKSYKYPF